MNNHQFTLDDKRPTRKFICPGCGKRELKRYQEAASRELFHAEKVGRMGRVVQRVRALLVELRVPLRGGDVAAPWRRLQANRLGHAIGFA